MKSTPSLWWIVVPNAIAFLVIIVDVATCLRSR